MFVPFAILMMPLVKQTAEMGLDNKVGVIILYTVFLYAYERASLFRISDKHSNGP